MALSDRRILQKMKAGNIVIEPFDRDNLNTSSYDVRLGTYFFREQRLERFDSVFDPWNKDDVERVWGSPHEAGFAEDVLPSGKLNQGGIVSGDRVIVISPGETILANTEEFIGGRNTVTTMMQARSTVGRCFIEVCKCAGWGDVGYVNRWAMEITNNSRHYAIPLRSGMRIAQIVFIETGPIIGPDYSSGGKYQKTTSIDELRANWEPTMMLPRLFQDRESAKQRQLFT